MNFQKIIKIVLPPVILAVLVKLINVFSFFIANLVYSKISDWDPGNSFLMISIHHIIQAVIALVIILVYGNVRNISFYEFGFRINGFKRSLKIILIFIAIWTATQLIFVYVFVKYFNQPILFNFQLTTRNILGHLAFQLFLSGTSEEILFRVMVIVVLYDLLKNVLRDSTVRYYLISVSTLIFMFDHINFSIFPITITHFNFWQQVTLLIFGIFYGWLFVKYKNYWSVASAHGALNVVIVSSSLFLLFLFKL